jgi:hypothetical protein
MNCYHIETILNPDRTNTLGLVLKVIQSHPYSYQTKN